VLAKISTISKSGMINLMFKKLSQSGVVDIPIIIVLVVGFFALFVIYTKYSDTNQFINLYQPKSQTIIKTSSQSAQTTDWKTYTNNKYSYSIKFPLEFNPEAYNARSGEFQEVNENANRIGFYKDRLTSFNGDLFEIQIITKNNSLEELAKTNFKENTQHFRTSSFSKLEKTQLDSNPAFEYTFKSNAISTNHWNAAVAENEYKIVYTEKEGVIYSFFFTNTILFNQILTTFMFTN
jgi:hypothetical protein